MYCFIQALYSRLSDCAQRLHGRTAARVEHAHLQVGGVCGNAHDAAQGIDFLNQVGLAGAATTAGLRWHGANRAPD